MSRPSRRLAASRCAGEPVAGATRCGAATSPPRTSRRCCWPVWQAGSRCPSCSATLPVWIVLAKLHGLYDRDHRVMRHLTSDELGSLIAWAATGSLAVLGLAGLVSEEQLAAADGVQLVLALALIAPATRATARWLWRCSVSPEQVLVVGSGRLARSTRRKLEIFGDMHQNLVPVTIEPPDVADPAQARATLDRVLAAHQLDRVVVAAETLEEPVVVALVIACRERVLKLGFVPPAPAAFASTARLGRLARAAGGRLADVGSVALDDDDQALRGRRGRRRLPGARRAADDRDRARHPAHRRPARRCFASGAPAATERRSPCGSSARCASTPSGGSEDLVVLEELAEPVFKLPDDPARDTGRALSAPHEPRRATAARQRAARPDEPRRPAARAGRARRPLLRGRARAGSPSSRG